MIEMTMGELLAVSDVLVRLSQHRFPIGQQTAAYRLSRIKKAVTSELQYFHSERKRIIEDLGRPRSATMEELAAGSETTVWEVLPGPSWGIFTQRLKEILNIKVELTCQQLTLNMLNSIELSAGDLEVLDKLLMVEVVIETEKV